MQKRLREAQGTIRSAAHELCILIVLTVVLPKANGGKSRNHRAQRVCDNRSTDRDKMSRPTLVL
jgi:hypothetical protein